jgi:hypothetical protein
VWKEFREGAPAADFVKRTGDERREESKFSDVTRLWSSIEVGISSLESE